MLKWTPDVFWRATLAEFDLAIVGHMESLGVEPEIEAPTREELDDLIARYGAK